jgi:lysozyme family protein
MEKYNDEYTDLFNTVTANIEKELCSLKKTVDKINQMRGKYARIRKLEKVFKCSSLAY